MNGRRFLLATASLALGATAAVVAVEIGLRLFSLAPHAGIFTVNEEEFSRVPGLFAPGQQITDRRIPALPHAVRIDSFGYRGPDFPLSKKPGERRVLAVGDSFTFGDFVDDEETVPAQIEKQLSRACRQPVTVVNAGVGGTTITTHIEMLRRGWVTGPDVVVLNFTENDITDLKTDMWNQFAENRKAKSRFPLSVTYPVLRRSAIWHFALNLRGRFRAGTEPVIGVDSSGGDPGIELQALRAEYRRSFRGFVEEVRSRGRDLVLFAAPSHLTTGGMIEDAHSKWLEEIATESGVELVNLLHVFRASGLPVDSLYLLPHDGHASPRGNALAGRAVAAQLVERGFCEGAVR